MRLTLRTLLAFLDNYLEPEDAKEISKKLEDSEFASSLVHRIRDVMRKTRLPAPGTSDKATALDPNSVAEYLDNTMPAEGLADFEKICLESDVELAEVASCHQILTLVLGEPAEVSPETRQRMYQLSLALAVATNQDEALAGNVTAATGSPAHEVQIRTKPEIPDYLRDKEPAASKALGRLIALALILIIVAGTVLVATGQFKADSPLMRMLAGKPAGEPGKPVAMASKSDEKPAAVPKVEPVAQNPLPTKTDNGAKTGQQPDEPAKAEGSSPANGKAPAANPAATPATKPGDNGSLAAKAVAPAVQPPDAPMPPDLTGRTPPPGNAASNATPAVPPAPMPGEAAPPAPLPPPSGDAKLAGNTKPPAPMLGEATPPAPLPPPGGDAKLASNTKPPAADPGMASSPAKTETPVEAAPLPAEPAGRYVSEKSVLLAYDPATTNWRRVPTHAVVNAGTTLLSLPAFQANLVLPAGATLQLLGGSEIALGPSDSQKISGINVHYGRAVLRAIGDAKAKLRIELGSRKGIVSLRTADSVLAIAITRSRLLTSDPEVEAAPLSAELYAASGEIGWEEAGSPPQVIPAASRLIVDDQAGRQPVPADLPKWVTTDETSWLDRRAAPMLEQALQADRPVALALRELADFRQREVAWLAVRCLGYVGVFEPMLAVLNSSDQKTVWDEYIAQLQEAVFREPKLAAAVRTAMEKQFGAEGKELYRMLWGYSRKELQGPAGNQLVEYLDHDQLAFRILAYYNLERTTGVKLNYRPQDTAAKRAPSIARWRDRLRSGLTGPDEKAAAPAPGATPNPTPGSKPTP